MGDGERGKAYYFVCFLASPELFRAGSAVFRDVFSLFVHHFFSGGRYGYPPACFQPRSSANLVFFLYLVVDLFVFASTSETQEMVLLEAMAGSCSVVAERANGVYGVIKDGYNGFKVAESTDIGPVWSQSF
ncbi:MAG: glycosyltransferase [Deltaproteobacteria bacterium]|nr:glycosyltransferase [Deltaproteobacteria bacterium]